MIMQLVKKDFLLVKKILPFMFIVSFVIPLFICSRIGEQLGTLSGFVAFYIQVIFVQFLLYNSVSLNETTFSKGQSLLCATPYTRNSLVKGKYAFNLILFVFCTIVFVSLTKLFPQIIGQITLSNISSVLLLMTALLGLEIPLEYKFGYDKIKYFFIGAMIITPYVLPLISKNLLQLNIDFSILTNIPPVAKAFIPFILALLIGSLSMILSIKIYSKKEL